MYSNDAANTVITADQAAEADLRYLWHPMTPYSETERPMIVTGGKGSWITDHKGNRYLDGMAGLWCVNTGYGRQELADAAYKQLSELAYFPLTQSHMPAIRLAEKLNEWLEGDYVIFFSNSGSDANETAFKIARQYQRQIGEYDRFKFISRYRGYHGSSLGALAATGQAQRKYQYEPLAGGFLHVRPPDSYRRPSGQSVEEFNLLRAQEIEDTILWEGKETIAGLIMEPAITGGGVLVPEPSYMERVQEICRKHGVLLIIDEVICGFGRSGRKFGHHNFGLKPDIVTMAKGLTSGYLPLSATAVRREIYDAFKGRELYSHFRHINTFGGNPAACALALKNLELMEEENLVARAAQLGEQLRAELTELVSHPLVGDIRSFGFMAGIELVADKSTKDPAPLALIKSVIGKCREAGVIIGKNGDTSAGYNNVLTVAPPFSTTDEELTLITTTIKQAIISAQYTESFYSINPNS
ncbi:aspartate aminotransferase family protein [Gorillibacterium massiliense]|uniref:aspartate aminotransferase family protein n=1 Tax=Gorillibacterium massiliense TaxID=1280390 RepID=UPI003B50A3F9